MSDKREGIKRRFRSEIKQNTYLYLREQLRKTQRKIEDNTLAVRRIASEQGALKKERDELHRMIEEFK